MPSLLRNAAFALLLIAGGHASAHAERMERPAPTGGVLSLLPLPQTTDHSIDLAGRTLHYKAKAGTLSLLSGKGDVTAEIFYVAYDTGPLGTPPAVRGSVRGLHVISDVKYLRGDVALA